jgi:hypothetical protein
MKSPDRDRWKEQWKGKEEQKWNGTKVWWTLRTLVENIRVGQYENEKGNKAK